MFSIPHLSYISQLMVQKTRRVISYARGTKVNKAHGFTFFAASLVLLLFSANNYALTTNDFTTYRDKDFNFSFWYPKSWKPVTTSFNETKIKVVSQSGEGIDDCNVVAIKRDMFRNYPPKDYLRDAENGFPKNLRSQFPDIQFIKSGVTSLSNREAYYTITEATVKSYNISRRTKFLTVVTLDSNKNNGTQYIVTCRTTPERFDLMHPIFINIMSGFIIKPNL